MIRKPIKVSNGAFVTGPNFEILMFTQAQARQYAREYAKRLNNSLVKNPYKFKFKGVRDCGEYWTYTIQ